jgi:hypothetical protein
MSARSLCFLQLAVLSLLLSPALQAETVTSRDEIAQETLVSSDQRDEFRPGAAVTGPPTLAVIPRQSSLAADKFEMEGISAWLTARFSPSELDVLQASDLTVEAHLCGCYDKPKKHYPYRMVVIKTPKGDLIARPENREVSVSFTALAVRRGDQYCDVDAESSCFGSFSDACDFSDFRYGPHLSIFFPTCMLDETETIATELDDARVY